MGPEPESTLSMRAWHTARELVVSLRESGVDVADRKKQWKDYEGTGSDSFVMRVHVDTEGKGKSRQTFIVWPFAESVSAGRQPHAKAKASCEERTGGYEMTVRLPWKLLGRKPRRGETWGLNVTSNPSVLRNRAFTWSPQYDAGPGNPILFGKVTFE